MGAEESDDGWDGVFGVAGLVECPVGGVSEGCGYGDGDGCRSCRLEFYKVERECHGEAEGGGEDREETPGELKETQFGEGVPDGGAYGGEEEGDRDGEDGQGSVDFGSRID